MNHPTDLKGQRMFTPFPISSQIQLHIYPTDQFKCGLFSVYFSLPLDREKSPLYSLVLSVLQRGTEEYANLAALNRRLDDLYATGLSVRNSWLGDLQLIGYSAELLGNRFLPAKENLLDGVLELITQMLFHPVLDPDGIISRENVHKAKLTMIDSIRAQINHPRGYAFQEFHKAFYKNEAYGASLHGTEEEIRAVTAETVTRIWKEMLSSASIHMFYTGPDQKEEIVATVKKYFGKVPAAPFHFRNTVIRSADGTQTIKKDMPVEQSVLFCGYRSGIILGEEDAYALLVMNELFGVDSVSKLFMNVREKKGLCYYCSSAINLFKGTITVSSGIRSDKYEETLQEIQKQLSDIQSGEISEAEMLAAKQSLVNSYTQIDDSLSSIERFYSVKILSRMGETDPDLICASVQKVQKEDVVRAAKMLTLDTVYFLNGTALSDEGEAVYES